MWLLAALLVVVIVAIAVPLAISSGGGKQATKTNVSPGAGTPSRTAPSVSVPSMAANLLPASALGPGWTEGGIGVGSSNGYASQCAEPLWSIFYPPNYPAGSQENFGGFPTGGIPLWTQGVAASNAGVQPTGSTFAEAVGEADKPRFEGLLATLASCGSSFYSFSKDDPIVLTPLQPFKFGTQSVGFLMTQTAHDQQTYIGFIVAGSKYSCFWFQAGRQPDRLTLFMQVAAKVAAQLNVG